MSKTLEEFWAEFDKHVEEGLNDSMPTIFRGISNHSYKLIPSIGRNTYENTHGNIESLENYLINDFKRLAIPELNKIPASYFEWLFLA